MPSITVHAYDHGASATAPLPNVWIYWKVDSKTTLLRTDAAGLLKAADLTKTASEPDPVKEMPWVYTASFDTQKGTTAMVAFTRGARPVPEAQLDPNRFTTFVVGDPWPAPYKAPPNTRAEEIWIGIGMPNAVGWMVNLDILLPGHKSTLTVPHELSLLPLLRENVAFDSDYYTEGLSQGADIWTDTTNFAGEDEAVEPLPANKRPKNLGLRFSGSVETRVTGLDLALVTLTGLPVLVHPTAASTDQLSIFPATLADGGDCKTFSADVWLAQPERDLGPLQLILHTRGAAPDYTDGYFLHVAGVQLGLVDDYEAAVNGKQPGASKLEADDRMIVDFLESPRPTLASLKGQTRARRMVPYNMHLRQRPFSTDLPTVVEMPEMPLFMVELQLVGLGESSLGNLLKYRQHLLEKNPDTIDVDFDASMNMSWDGPDAATNHARAYQYSADWDSGARKAKLKIDSAAKVSAEFDPAPAPVGFPVAGRRSAAARIKDVKRRWGRHAAANELDAVVLEWQPGIVDGAGVEIMRGGDGQVSLNSLTIAELDVLPPAVNDPVALLPRFRMQGTNPVANLDATIDLVVREYYDSHDTVAAVTSLSLATWQYTVRRILNHEARSTQFGFLARHYGIDGDAANYYGLERHMPIFGYPHGYGMGQLDNPAVTDDGAWSFIGNLRGSVALLMGDKANATHNLLSQHPAETDHWRACFQRNVIKQYNSGKNEFTWSGGAWKISPNQAQTKVVNGAEVANPELQYPNHVLADQTDVVYWTGSAAEPVFDWPILFVPANYGELP